MELVVIDIDVVCLATRKIRVIPIERDCYILAVVVNESIFGAVKDHLQSVIAQIDVVRVSYSRSGGPPFEHIYRATSMQRSGSTPRAKPNHRSTMR
jgi:hypothetical protein